MPYTDSEDLVGLIAQPWTTMGDDDDDQNGEEETIELYKKGQILSFDGASLTPSSHSHHSI